MAKKAARKSKKKSEDNDSDAVSMQDVVLEPTPKVLDREAWLNKYPNPDEKKIRWFYFGVVGFGVVIGLFWLVSIKFQMSYLNKRSTESNDIIQKTKQDWENIFADRDQKKNAANIKLAIQSALTLIASAPATTPSSTTSTIETTSSTLIIVTSTK